MEWVWVSVLLLASVLVWAFVKVMQLALAWKMVQELEKANLAMESAKELKTDLDLALLLEKWKAEGLG